MNKIKALREKITPDARYGSVLVSKFINCMMWKGKKSVSERIFYEALSIIEKRIKDEDPLKVFETAVKNVSPILEVKSKRIGGATYQVPVEVSPKRRQTLAIRWILQAARKKKGRPMAQRLASELIDAYHKEGAAYTTRENTHKMAEANKAFAHFG
ncbi:MAG: 30S ribosomal protein S7 [Planctomycetota bacterium]|nr:MAG: 30S ribosomal protein S7 [Planctomycetota bacterium]